VDPIPLLALILSALVAIAGGFAYLTGEIRKTGATAKRDNDTLRDHLSARIDTMVNRQNEERNALRTEFMNSISRVEQQLASISERAVRRQDLESTEARLARSNERTDAKIDVLSTRVNEALVTFSGGASR